MDAVCRAKHGISVPEKRNLEDMVSASAHQLDIFEVRGILLRRGKSHEGDGHRDILPLFQRKRGLGAAKVFGVADDFEVGEPAPEGVEDRGVGVDGADDEELVALEGAVVGHVEGSHDENEPSRGREVMWWKCRIFIFHAVEN